MECNHFLLCKAHSYRRKPLPEILDNCSYERERGLWVFFDSKEEMVKSKREDIPFLGTKKEDIETGEDAKGE